MRLEEYSERTPTGAVVSFWVGAAAVAGYPSDAAS